jgi:hypothetical protein
VSYTAGFAPGAGVAVTSATDSRRQIESSYVYGGTPPLTVTIPGDDGPVNVIEVGDTVTTGGVGVGAGEAVGTGVGDAVGVAVGDAVGAEVGLEVGRLLGRTLGELDPLLPPPPQAASNRQAVPNE